MSEFLSGFKLKWNLLSGQDLPPLAHIVWVISSCAVDIWDGVGATAVRQRYPAGEHKKNHPRSPKIMHYILILTSLTHTKKSLFNFMAAAGNELKKTAILPYFTSFPTKLWFFSPCWGRSQSSKPHCTSCMVSQGVWHKGLSPFGQFDICWDRFYNL